MMNPNIVVSAPEFVEVIKPITYNSLIYSYAIIMNYYTADFSWTETHWKEPGVSVCESLAGRRIAHLQRTEMEEGSKDVDSQLPFQDAG